MQESFEANKASIIKKMNEGLRDALDLEKDSVGPLTEDKCDLHRAFKLLLEEKGRKNIKEKVCINFPHSLMHNFIDTQ